MEAGPVRAIKTAKALTAAAAGRAGQQLEVRDRHLSRRSLLFCPSCMSFDYREGMTKGTRTSFVPKVALVLCKMSLLTNKPDVKDGVVRKGSPVCRACPQQARYLAATGDVRAELLTAPGFAP